MVVSRCIYIHKRCYVTCQKRLMCKTVTVMDQNVRSDVFVYGIIKGPVFVTYKQLIRLIN